MEHVNGTETILARIRATLLGDYFSSLKDLRHCAEAAGFSFVPVEKLAGGERDILVALRPKGAPEIHVRATRTQTWHPFLITAVEPATS